MPTIVFRGFSSVFVMFLTRNRRKPTPDAFLSLVAKMALPGLIYGDTSSSVYYSFLLLQIPDSPVIISETSYWAIICELESGDILLEDRFVYRSLLLQAHARVEG